MKTNINDFCSKLKHYKSLHPLRSDEDEDEQFLKANEKFIKQFFKPRLDINLNREQTTKNKNCIKYKMDLKKLVKILQIFILISIGLSLLILFIAMISPVDIFNKDTFQLSIIYIMIAVALFFVFKFNFEDK